MLVHVIILGVRTARLLSTSVSAGTLYKVADMMRAAYIGVSQHTCIDDYIIDLQVP